MERGNWDWRMKTVCKRSSTLLSSISQARNLMLPSCTMLPSYSADSYKKTEEDSISMWGIFPLNHPCSPWPGCLVSGCFLYGEDSFRPSSICDSGVLLALCLSSRLRSLICFQSGLHLEESHLFVLRKKAFAFLKAYWVFSYSPAK